jgi:hypothetical protein
MPLIQILGPGCPKCKKLAENADAAAALALIGVFWERLAAHEKQRMRPPLDH